LAYWIGRAYFTIWLADAGFKPGIKHSATYNYYYFFF
jgi:hypothetical protein